ncbi:hypothetical protein TWF718_000472 [Orbilia javanica]|uniref:NACHT domain-containing protein n=1 Tax=Orbilia javanica TaxID=47235 RepID=A0AAN8RM02_9PEZI
MDGLSAAASVIAVIDVSAKLLGVLGKYYKDVKGAKADIQQLTKQVESLHGVLENIQTLIEGKDETKIPGIQPLKDSLVLCKSQEQELLDQLPEQRTTLRFSRSLKWPFKGPRIKEILIALESSKTTLSNSLVSSNLTISIGTREEVETANAGIKAAELQEKRKFLQNLEAEGAAFNSHKQQHDPKCLENTRIDVLKAIESWATHDDSPGIFWLRGMAGTGKSTISRTIAESLSANKTLGASFFFSRGDGDRGRATKFVTTIASQLASHIAPFEESLHKTINQLGSTNIPDLDFRSQWSKLVINPLSESSFSSGSKQIIILVIDALDECGREEDARLIVDLLRSNVSISQSVELRTYITSRPESYITRAFDIIPEQSLSNIALHDISQDVVQADIKHFLQFEFQRIGKTRSLPLDWITEEQVEVLTKKSDGLFIYAATVCRFINDDEDSPKNFLKTALEESKRGVSTTPDLDEIYLEILKRVILGKCKRNQKESRSKKFKEIVGCLILLSQNFTVENLAGFLDKDVDSVREFLRLLSSVLDVPKSGLKKSEVRLLHPSFRDFLLDLDRCPDTNFQVSEKEMTKTMALRCVDIMRRTLRKDICGLKLLGLKVEDVEKAIIDANIPETTKHACLYWVDYLKRSGISLEDNDEFHKFLQDHILHWFEALSLMGELSEGIRMIESLLSMLGDSRNKVYSFVYDAKRFVCFNRSVIERRPLQIYLSCLIFSPSQCLIRRQNWGVIPSWIKSAAAVQENWDLCVQTLEGHLDAVKAVAFSHDGKQLASGSTKNAIKLWDTTTGATLATLEGDFGGISSLAFSSDDKRLIYVSWESGLGIWNIVTGASLGTFQDRLGSSSIAQLSHDGRRLAFGTRSMAIEVWDIATNACLATLEGHSDFIACTAFSFDGKWLASSSLDNTLKLWDIATQVCLATLERHSSRALCTVFSFDGKWLASSYMDNTIKLWDIATQVRLATLEGHSNWTMSAAFSFDGKWLASGSMDRTIKLWDTATHVCFATLKGHSEWARCIAFSSNGELLASGCEDQTIKLWDTNVKDNIIAEGSPAASNSHLTPVSPLAFSRDGKRLASSSYNKTIKLWDTATGACIAFGDTSDYIGALAFLHDDKDLVLGFGSGIKLWDMAKSTSLITESGLITLEMLPNPCSNIAFSNDDGYLAAGSRYSNGNINFWDINKDAKDSFITKSRRLSLKGHSRNMKTMVFSHDNKHLASGYEEGVIEVWDLATSSSPDIESASGPSILEGNSSPVRSIAFSHSHKYLASISSDQTIKLWNVPIGHSSTIRRLAIFEGHSGGILSFAFSQDDRYLVSCSDDNTIKLWDIATALDTPSTQDGLVLIHRYQDLFVLPSYFQLSDACFGNDAIAMGTKSGHVFVIAIQNSPDSPPPPYFQFTK